MASPPLHNMLRKHHSPRTTTIGRSPRVTSPEGSNLSCNKAFLEEYPEDEANSKKTKKNNTEKGKKGYPKTKV